MEGSTAVATTGSEMGLTAAAAEAKAVVESRYYMALRHQRNWDQVRQDILQECRRPRFAANKSTHYHKPIGRAGVEGLGIRFVEMALRCMTNVMVETSMIYEDEHKEIHRVTVTDLENNVTYPMDVRVQKTVERSRPDSDGAYLSVRKNSRNQDVFTLAANDEEMQNKRMALISKGIRSLGLRIIPGDIRDEAEEMILRIRNDTAARDPDGEKKKMCDEYLELGIRAIDLTNYLGHELSSISPQEIVELRGLYGAIRDGEATWKEAMEGRKGQVIIDIDLPFPNQLPGGAERSLPEAQGLQEATQEASLMQKAGIGEKDFARYLQSVGWLKKDEDRISMVGEARMELIRKNEGRFVIEAKDFLQREASCPPQAPLPEAPQAPEAEPDF